jgi:predicted Rdx family selenoprotein
MDISQLITKLEEVVSAIRETAGTGGESNITINVSSTYEGQSSENEEGDGTDDDKALAQKIKDVVKQTISEEKRVGGLLSNLKA